MKKLLRLSVSFTFVALLGGCAMFNTGESDYSCQGIGDGEATEGCMSVREAYEATSGMADMTGVRTPAPQQAIENARHVAETYVAPNLPDKPVPVRTPAEVMRIWIAPWENEAGDLVVSGYIYTEIEPRRWVLGSQAGSESGRGLSPLR